MDVLKCCNLCPRNCSVDRYKALGFCRASNKIKIAYYSLHEWEEPIISGDSGSGTIFFSNCNLKCLFCQNKKISTEGYGKEISNDTLIDIIFKLQKMGAHNINLVTPTMYVPQIIKCLSTVKPKLEIPIVYNTSSYENVSTIKMLDGYIDIYLADFKYFDNSLGIKYSKCDNYFEIASEAIEEMFKQIGKYKIVNNLLKKGIVVRVLVLPGHTDDAKKIIYYLYNKYGNSIFISIMNQYTPIVKCDEFPNLNRKLTIEEYDDVVNYAIELGVVNAFIQEGETQSDSFIPNFDYNIIEEKL